MTPAFACFVVLLAGTGLMRLVELAVSRRRIAARPDALVEEPWLFPAMAALHAGLVALPLVEVWWLSRPFSPALWAAAGAVFALAVALRVWTLSTIGRAWNVRVVVPDDDAIATDGPYRFVRHPNYLVVILEIASLPLLHGAWISAAVLSALDAVVLAARIRTEERALSEVPAWREAMRDRARLVPYVF